jgi:hypothetical protein
VSVVSSGSSGKLAVPEATKPFLTDDAPQAVVRVHSGALPEVDLGEPVFESGGVWSLYRSLGKHLVLLRAPGPQAPPYGLAVFEPDFCSGDIYLQDGDVEWRMLSYPLDEVLMIHLLARGRGVLLHAFGIREGGGGTLFAGVSGAGKSTLATLWEGQEGVPLLSDDRVVVRQRDDRFWAYGTPWCGDARAASPGGAPLERIFIIRQGSANRAVRLRPMDAASALLVRSFPTFWDAEGMAFTLDFLGRLSQSVPCYLLDFVPDASVVDYVRSLT